MRQYEIQQWARVLVDMAETVPDERLDEAVSVFVSFLAEKGGLRYWREILRAMDHVWSHQYGAAHVTVTSAHPLSAKLRTTLEQTWPGADIQEKVDSEMIGGAVLRVDDRIFDGSVLGRLQQMKKHLGVLS
ncbi:MAG: ATP synthase subunit delta [Candidatus Uhrbacteria bacterium GW2011_GWF2_41_16]|uniref:ATP synthase subunit delta n=2 Tax=Candidatus Uhriibacteriota TaxID=1752732 RepID=A0A0G0YBL0_9BACT|nr:MAG: ATP synthase subunit delta [Candidatus Uhrbacteria bacterium GW2011_GWA2_41_10]KKR86810.1 MAG: ATP synthase subunit delta [Candidatus Uhrbacteria bacterium GW2011_GWC2_41_11]KKR97687.1 MAG: ATP synthase subunit delta [Candidatus Uhrbacteria bacterium GW2011_GWF2_41_16]HBO99707.1 hypothetical protein [Candidatus Uhrbacteria bacterium]